jgi:hypothetical protein
VGGERSDTGHARNNLSKLRFSVSGKYNVSEGCSKLFWATSTSSVSFAYVLSRLNFGALLAASIVKRE